MSGGSNERHRNFCRAGSFNNIDDFFRNSNSIVLNQGVLTALIRSGALDSLWGERLQLLEQANRLSNLAQAHRKAEVWGERPLFPIRYEPKGSRLPSERDAAERAEGEQETIGVRLTFPRITLTTTRGLITSEMDWLNQVLSSREPESEIYLNTCGYITRLPLRSSTTGLMNVVSKIGLGVEIW